MPTFRDHLSHKASGICSTSCLDIPAKLQLLFLPNVISNKGKNMFCITIKLASITKVHQNQIEKLCAALNKKSPQYMTTFHCSSEGKVGLTVQGPLNQFFTCKCVSGFKLYCLSGFKLYCLSGFKLYCLSGFKPYCLSGFKLYCLSGFKLYCYLDSSCIAIWIQNVLLIWIQTVAYLNSNCIAYLDSKCIVYSDSKL